MTPKQELEARILEILNTRGSQQAIELVYIIYGQMPSRTQQYGKVYRALLDLYRHGTIGKERISLLNEVGHPCSVTIWSVVM